MEATFLKEGQIWGNSALEVMKSYGTKTGMSDLAIVLGGYMGSGETIDGQRTGWVWSASSSGDGDVRTVNNDGDRNNNEPGLRDGGARPALPSSVTSTIKLSEAKLPQKITGLDGKEIDVVEYGEYPQTIAPIDVSTELEQARDAKKLQATGKKYTFDGENYDSYDKPFTAKEYAEYQYKGENYIRVEAHPHGESFLSNGHKVQEGEICWIKAQPIKWMVEPKGSKDEGWWVARQALFSGVQFDSKQSYDGVFENTDIYRFTNRHFLKDMQVNRTVDTPAAAEPGTADFAARMAIQRQRALDDPSQGL